MNSYRRAAGLAPLSFAFSASAQQCSIANAASWVGHCSQWENITTGLGSQDGDTAASGWYSEGPPAAGDPPNHYSNMMSPAAQYGYYGWAYDPASGTYVITLDFRG